VGYSVELPSLARGQGSAFQLAALKDRPVLGRLRESDKVVAQSMDPTSQRMSEIGDGDEADLERTL
jgi:hypothetical protein